MIQSTVQFALMSHEKHFEMRSIQDSIRGLRPTLAIETIVKRWYMSLSVYNSKYLNFCVACIRLVPQDELHDLYGFENYKTKSK